jgi:hypothetical protein
MGQGAFSIRKLHNKPEYQGNLYPYATKNNKTALGKELSTDQYWYFSFI